MIHSAQWLGRIMPMMTLYDLMMGAQHGEAMEAFARRFGLSPDAARMAVNALMPAFSFGLKRQAASPEGMGRLMTLMGAGAYAPYYQNAMAALPPQLAEKGEEVLRAVFETERVKKAIAAKAAAEAGVQEAIMIEMMPAIAATLMGGLAQEAKDNPLLKPWLDLMAQPQGTPRPPEPPAPPKPEPTPFGSVVDAWMESVAPAPRPEAPPVPAPAAEPEPVADLIQSFFESGRKLQSAQLAAWTELIEGALKSATGDEPGKTEA